MRWWKKLGLLVVAMALVACGNADVDAAKVASEGATAFESVNNFHFKLTVSEGEAAPLGDIIIIDADGDSIRPDKIQAKIKAKLAGAPIAVNINGIIIGADAWITPNPFNPTAFEKLEDTGGLETFSPAKGISDVLRGLKTPTFVEEAEIDGTATYHISGEVDAQSVSALTGGVAEAGTIKLDLWIGKDDKLLRQLVAVGRLVSTEKETIKRTLIVSKFNQTLTIEPPQ
ncbi:MAG TPA: LppX_LprAFG lipoprotein [Herpetosiphon sp.]|uniref:LppX_LprAFG lipoprotein n=1 Tax=Herpetosiphon aurantiacus (strain ATCC 23779 / DSM 785 / 114-95) TaxID=316274 RepID=A9B111_HERA2|nr:LppX_LprAFG lipoprotein [Herpetosiphon sp.]ABX05289.1 hypothetical protein Haur_2651 [Herpetosiphon aurantiacus DSM 785]HBW51202.1 LppX_LprAFG lipoprotein [Herpetosiphon sp.]